MTEFSVGTSYVRTRATAERVMRDGASIVSAAGRVLLSTVESANDTAVNIAASEIDPYKIECGDRSCVLAEIEATVNNPEAHKGI